MNAPIYNLLDDKERVIAHGSKEAVYAAASLLLGTRQLATIYDKDSFGVPVSVRLFARADAERVSP